MGGIWCFAFDCKSANIVENLTKKKLPGRVVGGGGEGWVWIWLIYLTGANEDESEWVSFGKDSLLGQRNIVSFKIGWEKMTTSGKYHNLGKLTLEVPTPWMFRGYSYYFNYVVVISKGLDIYIGEWLYFNYSELDNGIITTLKRRSFLSFIFTLLSYCCGWICLDL